MCFSSCNIFESQSQHGLVSMSAFISQVLTSSLLKIVHLQMPDLLNPSFCKASDGHFIGEVPGAQERLSFA
jgi:hypothetical protein